MTIKPSTVIKNIAIGGAATLIAITAVRLCYIPKQNVMIRGKTYDSEVAFKNDNIRWMKKVDDCYYVCINPKGCFESIKWEDKYKVCIQIHTKMKSHKNNI